VTPRGHAIEFRLNGEDSYNSFMPAPGTLSTVRWPGGPGVRVDTGVQAGDVISGAFDSMLAKVIITGADRTQALERARRALAETEVNGIPTVLPFFTAVLTEPDFTATNAEDFAVHTTWIESDFAGRLTRPEPAAPAAPSPAAESAPEEETERVVVEVGGKRLEVVLPAGLSRRPARTKAPRRPSRRNTPRASGGAGGNGLASPMQGTIVKIAVEEGQTVQEGDLVVVLEAMKMEQPLNAHRSGTVKDIAATVGQTVSAGTVLCQIESEEPAGS